jgi:hypothetical protein
MSKIFALSLVFIAAGCGGQLGSDDGAADEAALAGDGKADLSANATAGIVGNYQLTGDATHAGDVAYLLLRSDGEFAWTRCYDAGCVTSVVEDGSYKLTTSSGKKYVTFSQIGPAGDLKTHFNSMYEYKRASKALSLRLTRTSRWQTLASVTDAALCKASGGLFASGNCDCGGGWPIAWSPGAGGCWTAPAVGESLCDDTAGNWSDDETNAAGTFCDCGYAHQLTDAGCVAR